MSDDNDQGLFMSREEFNNQMQRKQEIIDEYRNTVSKLEAELNHEKSRCKWIRRRVIEAILDNYD